MCLAHWIISQRSIHIVLANKSAVLRRDKLIPTANKSTGDLIVACRKEAGLTQEKLARMSGIPWHWIGRWERGRVVPDAAQWAKLSKILRFPANRIPPVLGLAKSCFERVSIR
jgi:DNA-binding transcriptional regulator YiaG